MPDTVTAVTTASGAVHPSNRMSATKEGVSDVIVDKNSKIIARLAVQLPTTLPSVIVYECTYSQEGRRTILFSVGTAETFPGTRHFTRGKSYLRPSCSHHSPPSFLQERRYIDYYTLIQC